MQDKSSIYAQLKSPYTALNHCCLNPGITVETKGFIDLEVSINSFLPSASFSSFSSSLFSASFSFSHFHMM